MNFMIKIIIENNNKKEIFKSIKKIEELSEMFELKVFKEYIKNLFKDIKQNININSLEIRDNLNELNSDIITSRIFKYNQT